MTAPSLNNADVYLRFRHEQWQALHTHLFADTLRARARAAMRSGHYRREAHLLVREVIPALDGTDYVPGVRGYRHLGGAFVTRALRRAKNAGLVYLAVHNHGGMDERISGTDMASHERGYPHCSASTVRPSVASFSPSAPSPGTSGSPTEAADP